MTAVVAGFSDACPRAQVCGYSPLLGGHATIGNSKRITDLVVIGLSEGNPGIGDEHLLLWGEVRGHFVSVRKVTEIQHDAWSQKISSERISNLLAQLTPQSPAEAIIGRHSGSCTCSCHSQAEPTKWVTEIPCRRSFVQSSRAIATVYLD